MLGNNAEAAPPKPKGLAVFQTYDLSKPIGPRALYQMWALEDAAFGIQYPADVHFRVTAKSPQSAYQRVANRSLSPDKA